MHLEPLSNTDGVLPGFRRVQCRVRYASFRQLRPEVLWFDTPADHHVSATQAMHAFVVALLPLAFRLKEPVESTEPIDPTLFTNLQRLQEVWARWYAPQSPVALNLPTLASDPVRPGVHSAVFFTGGVDSFFTLLHLDHTPAARADHLLSVWGYDIPLNNPDAWQQRCNRLQAVAQDLGISWIPIVTNLRQTRLRHLDWGSILHGPALAAVGLLLGREFGRTYISSACYRDDDEAWGSHQLTDPCMSTQSTQMVHYAPEVTRFDKTAFIVQYPVALRSLQVCWRDGSDANCGRCEKCLRTLISLELLGVRSRAVTFPSTLALEDVRALTLDNQVQVELLRGLLPQAISRGRPDIAEAIDTCLQRNLGFPRRKGPSAGTRIRNRLLTALRLRPIDFA